MQMHEVCKSMRQTFVKIRWICDAVLQIGYPICKASYKNSTLLSPTMMAFLRKCGPRVLEFVMVYHIPTNFNNCAASVLSGKYDLTAATVVSFKKFKAS